MIGHPTARAARAAGRADTPPLCPAKSTHGLWHRVRRHVLAALVAIGFFTLWESAIWIGGYPQFILPSPRAVAVRFSQAVADGILWRHTCVTLFEVTLGLAMGLSSALVIGYFLAKSRTLEEAVSPYIVALQAVPIVALAPLVLIWFGNGLLSKVIICALVTFFPTLVATINGVRSVEPDLRDLMRSLEATPWQTFRYLELPGSLPIIFGGLKVSATLSVIGAVVGEFIAADAGLGYLVNAARGVYDTPLLFVALVTLAAIALALYGLVTLLERHLLAWRAAARYL